LKRNKIENMEMKKKKMMMNEEYKECEIKICEFGI
jgi:hypothetical protein